MLKLIKTTTKQTNKNLQPPKAVKKKKLCEHQVQDLQQDIWLLWSILLQLLSRLWLEDKKSSWFYYGTAHPEPLCAGKVRTSARWGLWWCSHCALAFGDNYKNLGVNAAFCWKIADVRFIGGGKGVVVWKHVNSGPFLSDGSELSGQEDKGDYDWTCFSSE